MLTGLVIPKIYCLSELGRPFRLGTNNEVISAAILRHDERIRRKAPPITHPGRLPDNIIACSCKSFAVTGIEEGNQLPTIASNFNLAAIVS